MEVDTRTEHDEALHTLAEEGYCVVPGVLGAAETDELRDALDRAAGEDDTAGRASRYGPGQANQRVWALLNRGDSFARLASHPLALHFVRAHLGPDVLLSNLTANITAPGGDHEIGRLHTDQGYLPEPWPQLLAMNVAWFVDDFTFENGATLVVPGSHRSLAPPSDVDLAPSAPAHLAGPAGSMAVWDGRLHHATGLNRTADQRRRGVLATYCPPFIRGQENWTRSLDPAVLASHPELGALTGFDEWQTLGAVNGPSMSGLNF
jgi:ectoine hydroxylase-related dioxygenase (phytanoyl-CoA dioxygenase family)